MLRLSMISLAVLAVAHGTKSPACDLNRPGHEFCADFCDGKCSFYNVSAGETGEPMNITMYRITPRNVTGLVNKNTADAPGDITFVISKKNITQQCLKHPESLGCHTDQEDKDMYGQFIVEVDGQWGPYQMCNPADGWDTSEWFCGQECFEPTHKGCGKPWRKFNGTGYSGSPMCWCERAKMSAGREQAPGSTGHRESDMPKDFPPQCNGGFRPLQTNGCIEGHAYKTLTGWSFASVASMACQTCYADSQCTGWRTLDDRTAELFDSSLKNVSQHCKGALRHRDQYGGGNWMGVADLGGCTTAGCTNVWYSTTKEAECPPGRPLGYKGCSWRLVEERKYANASCVDAKADAAVERHGAKCFSKCPKPLDKKTDCYLDCYRNTLTGDASQNITAVDTQKMVVPWIKAFTENDPAKGGCPHIKPIVGPM